MFLLYKFNSVLFGFEYTIVCIMAVPVRGRPERHFTDENDYLLEFRGN